MHLSGRVDRAIALLERAVSALASRGHVPGRAKYMTALGEALHAAGRAPEATALARQAVDFVQAYGMRAGEGAPRPLLGSTEAHRREFAAAEHSYRQALAVADDLGLRPLSAHCHLGLGMVHRHRGQYQEGRAHLTTAATMYREMGMARWLDRADAELGEIGDGP